MIRVDVLVPVYNAANWLSETIESALSQRHVDVRVVALDDGSRDDSLALLRAYGDRIEIHAQPNAGASATRNRLTTLSDAPWVVYLDADDVLAPDTLATRLGVAMASGADAVYCDWVPLVPDGTNGWREEAPVARNLADSHSDPLLALFGSFWAPPAAWLLARQLVDRIGGWSTDLPVIQDARFMVDAAFAGATFARAAHVGARYRRHAQGSLSQRDPSAFVSDCLLNARQIESRLEAMGRRDLPARRVLRDCFDYVLRESTRSPARFVEALTGLRRQRAADVPLSRAARLADALDRMGGADIARTLMRCWRWVRR